MSNKAGGDLWTSEESISILWPVPITNADAAGVGLSERVTVKDLDRGNRLSSSTFSLGTTTVTEWDSTTEYYHTSTDILVRERKTKRLNLEVSLEDSDQSCKFEYASLSSYSTAPFGKVVRSPKFQASSRNHEREEPGEDHVDAVSPIGPRLARSAFVIPFVNVLYVAAAMLAGALFANFFKVY
jgi:hypothetical protein